MDPSRRGMFFAGVGCARMPITKSGPARIWFWPQREQAPPDPETRVHARPKRQLLPAFKRRRAFFQKCQHTLFEIAGFAAIALKLCLQH